MYPLDLARQPLSTRQFGLLQPATHQAVVVSEWKIQGSDDTDADGWQYLNGVPRGKVLPQHGWVRKGGVNTLNYRPSL